VQRGILTLLPPPLAAASHHQQAERKALQAALQEMDYELTLHHHLQAAFSAAKAAGNPACAADMLLQAGFEQQVVAQVVASQGQGGSGSGRRRGAAV
jgi:hypothetical protein